MTTDNRKAAPDKSAAHRFSWRERGGSFIYAFRGIRLLIAGEHNARLHLVAACLAVAFGIWLQISPLEWCAVVICIGGVFALEAVNSAVEALADRISTQHSPLLGRAKDIAAAAVLIFAIASVVVAGIIFIPKLLALL